MKLVRLHASSGLAHGENAMWIRLLDALLGTPAIWRSAIAGKKRITCGVMWCLSMKCLESNFKVMGHGEVMRTPQPNN